MTEVGARFEGSDKELNSRRFNGLITNYQQIESIEHYEACHAQNCLLASHARLSVCPALSRGIRTPWRPEASQPLSTC